MAPALACMRAMPSSAMTIWLRSRPHELHIFYRARRLVNLAARLEGLNKNYGTQVLVSAAVKGRVEGRYRFPRRRRDQAEEALRRTCRSSNCVARRMKLREHAYLPALEEIVYAASPAGSAGRCTRGRHRLSCPVSRRRCCAIPCRNSRRGDCKRCAVLRAKQCNDARAPSFQQASESGR